MELLLFIVFAVVLFFAVLTEILPGISKKVVDLVVQSSEEETALKARLKELNDELRTINMVDDFAKYARTERKINKLKEQLAEIKKSKTSVFLKFKLGFNLVFHIIQIVCYLTLIYLYRGTPLITIPEDWVWPIGSIVAFPTGVAGAVSITFWLLICRTVVKKGIQLCGR